MMEPSSKQQTEVFSYPISTITQRLSPAPNALSILSL